MAAWKDFEKLAKKIYTELSPDAFVKYNDYIQGKDTGKKRQIDTSIRWEDGVKEYLTIIQAKDYKKPADINAVGTFLSVVNDVEASGGILICTSGFTKDAHIYARNVGIKLVNLHDSKSIKWNQQLTIPILWTELQPEISIRGAVHLEAGDTISTDDPLGPPITHSDIRMRINPGETFRDYWNNNKLNTAPGVFHTIKSVEPLKLIVRDKTGNFLLRPLLNFVICYTVNSKTWQGTFTPSECRGIIDYLDDKKFTASYLPLAEIPIKRDNTWAPIPSATEYIKNSRGTVVGTTNTVKINILEMSEITFSLINKK